MDFFLTERYRLVKSGAFAMVSLSRTMMRFRVILGLILSMLASHVSAQTCPKAIETSLRLLVVTTATMNDATASLQLYRRAAASEGWVAEGAPFPVVVGKSGLAWGNGFSHLAGPGEREKVEGDFRTPAGVFPIGSTFGFEPSSFPGHIQLKAGESICVDDPASPHYNRIVKRQQAGNRVRGEDMRGSALYRKGVFVNYDTDRGRRSGSCIFLHVWRSSLKGTSGCVAMPEMAVERIQEFTRKPSALAVLPKAALQRFGACLPSAGSEPRR